MSKTFEEWLEGQPVPNQVSRREAYYAGGAYAWGLPAKRMTLEELIKIERI